MQQAHQFYQIRKLIILNLLSELKDENVGGKFKKTARSFFDLIASIFDFGTVPLTGDTKGNLSYLGRIKDNWNTFSTNLGTLFDAMARQTVAVLTGYTTDEKIFFDGVRNDLVIMFKKIVRGIGEAFYAAYPTIAANLGFISAEENKADDFRKAKGNEIIDTVMGMDAGSKRREYIESLGTSTNDALALEEYARLLGESEKMKIANKLFNVGDSRNANLISDIFTGLNVEADKRNFIQYMSNIYGRLVGDTGKNRKIVNSYKDNRDTNLSETRDAGEKFYDKIFEFLESPRKALGLTSSQMNENKINAEIVFLKKVNAEITKTELRLDALKKALIIEGLIDRKLAGSIISAPNYSNTKINNVNNQTNNALAANPNGILTGYSYTGMNPH